MTDNRIGSTSTTAQMQLNRAGPSHHRPYPSDDWSQRLDRQSKDHHHHSGADTLAMAMIVLVVFVGVDCCPALQSRRIRASMTFDPKSSPAPRLSARRASSLSSLIFFSSQRHTSIYRVHEQNTPAPVTGCCYKYPYCLSCVCLAVNMQDFCKKPLSDFNVTWNIYWYYGLVVRNGYNVPTDSWLVHKKLSQFLVYQPGVSGNIVNVPQLQCFCVCYMSYIFILLLCFIYIVGDDGVCLSASKKVYVCCSQILEETYGDGRRLIAEKEEKRQHSCR